MAWWGSLFKRAAKPSLAGREFRSVCTLHSRDGQRAAEVLEFAHGETYLRESEWVEGAFVDRHGGSLVGPFASPEKAERFIVATAWFTGQAD